MIKQTPAPEQFETDYMNMRAEHFNKGLQDTRLEEFSGKLTSVAALVGAVGNEAISGARQDDEVTPDNETLPAVVHHIDIETLASDPAEVAVSTKK